MLGCRDETGRRLGKWVNMQSEVSSEQPAGKCKNGKVSRRQNRQKSGGRRQKESVKMGKLAVSSEQSEAAKKYKKGGKKVSNR